MRLIFILTKSKKAELGLWETVVLDLSKKFKNTRILLNPATTYPLTTDHLSTDPPTSRRNKHRPTDKFMFKRLENMKTFILQNVNAAGNIENHNSAYYLFE